MNKKIKKLIEKARKDFLTMKDKRHCLVSYVLDSKYRIIATGYNSYSKTHSLQARIAAMTKNRSRIFLHSEIAALARIIRNRKIKPIENASKIFIIRFNKNGSLALACPCEICRIAIQLSGIEEIIYTTRDGVNSEESWP